jgi:DNA-binding NarL/FixJ family response regulator
MSLRLALVDDHRLFREGLRTMIATQPDLEVVGEAGEALEAYSMVESTRPDVLVLDLALPGATGVTVAREVLRRSPKLRVLLLSMLIDEEHVAQALDAGVAGYAAKEQSADEVFQAIRAVGAGKSYLSPLISRFILEEYMRLRRGGAPSDSPLRTLTGREREIFELSVRGLSNETISAQLTISKRTVETHRGRIMRKLGVHSAADLVRVAARHGLLQV